MKKHTLLPALISASIAVTPAYAAAHKPEAKAKPAVKTENPIPAGCITALLDSINSTASLKACKNAKAADNGMVIKYLGVAGPYHYIQTTTPSAAPGGAESSGVMAVQVKGDKLTSHSLIYGNGCNMGLASAKVDKTGLTQAMYYTPWELVNYTFPLGNEQRYATPYHDLMNGTNQCIGIMRFHYARKTEKLSPVSFTLGGNVDLHQNFDTAHTGGAYRLQNCLFDILRPYFAKTRTVKAKKLAAIRSTFAKKCAATSFDDSHIIDDDGGEGAEGE